MEAMKNHAGKMVQLDSEKKQINKNLKSAKVITAKNDKVFAGYGTQEISNVHSDPEKTIEEMQNLLNAEANKQSKVQEHNGDVSKSKTGAYIALFLCCVDGIFFSTSFISVQYLSGAVPENELNSLRFLTTAIITLPFIFNYKIDMLLPRSQWKILVVACILGVVNNSTLYTAAIYLPVGTVSAICTATTIIVLACISPCIEKQLKPITFIGALVAVVGILLLSQPEFLMFPKVEIRNTSWVSPCLSLCENGTVAEEGGSMWNFLTSSGLGYALAMTSGIAISLNLHVMKSCVAEINPFCMIM